MNCSNARRSLWPPDGPLRSRLRQYGDQQMAIALACCLSIIFIPRQVEIHASQRSVNLRAVALSNRARYHDLFS